jgi:glycosyltransferase involved in cell wall biosynthesis
LLDEEKELVRTADLVTVTAKTLERKWASQARRVLVAGNGADFDFFAERTRANDRLSEVPGPIIGYYGGLASWFDFDLVAAVARARPDWQFVIIGGTFDDEAVKLDGIANLMRIGHLPYKDLPEYLFHFDVCLIPFRVNDITKATDPIKLYEYLSVGKPVVTTPLPEIAHHGDYVYISRDPQEFLVNVERALAESDPSLAERRINAARANTWQARVDAMRAAFADLCVSK